MYVDLLLDPGREVGHVAVHARPQHLAEADAAPGRQAEERPAETLVFLAHQRAAAVALKHTAGYTDGSDPELTTLRASGTMQESTVPASYPAQSILGVIVFMSK